jgi:Protein ENHANCED DISEASE RESISTANCE 2, C-terminal
VIPLQYYFRDPAANTSGKDLRGGGPQQQKHGTYEIDIIITASSIAKGILSVVKSQTKCVTIAFALIIEAAEPSELPENILCSFQIHSLHLEECPPLPDCNLDDLLP